MEKRQVIVSRYEGKFRYSYWHVQFGVRPQRQWFECHDPSHISYCLSPVRPAYDLP